MVSQRLRTPLPPPCDRLRQFLKVELKIATQRRRFLTGIFLTFEGNEASPGPLYGIAAPKYKLLARKTSGKSFRNEVLSQIPQTRPCLAGISHES